MMRTRGSFRFMFAAFCIIAGHPGPGAAHAQGFRPDPFRPFNAQYDQYVYPIRPETGGSAAPARNLSRGETPYERWLMEQDAGSRLATERYGAGLPYYRVRSDFERDRRELARKRNAGANAELGSIMQKYLAYFSEENPSKRAILLRDYTPTEGSDDMEPADDDTAAPARRARGGAAGTDGTATARGSSTKTGDERVGRRIPPPPDLPGAGRGSGRSTSRRPSDVLDRARRLDDGDRELPRSPSTKRLDRRIPRTPPSDE